MSRDKIRVEVSFENMSDSNTEFACLIDVDIYIASGIDYGTRLFAGQHVRTMGDFFQKMVFQ
jgi:hypothetical protein